MSNETTTAHQDCPHSANCAMYELFRKSGTLGIWQLNYCSATYTNCARHQLASEGRPVPLTLLPNGKQMPT